MVGVRGTGPDDGWPAQPLPMAKVGGHVAKSAGDLDGDASESRAAASAVGADARIRWVPIHNYDRLS